MPIAASRRVLAVVSALALGVAGTLVAVPALAEPSTDPTPLGPAADALLTDTTPGLTWSAGVSDLPDTLRYRVEILSGGSTVRFGAAVFDTSWSPTIPLPDGDYTWRVRGIDRIASAGPWSSQASFSIDTTAPVIALLAPSAGTANAAGVTVSGTVSDVNPARVELRDNGSLVATDDSGGATFSFAYTPPSGERTLTVTAIDAAGNSGSASSASVELTVDSDAPTGVVTYGNTAPINGNVMAYLTPSETVTVTTPGWVDIGGDQWRKKFTKNALSPNYDQPVEFVDAFGNPGSAQVYIDWIDVIAPTAQVTYSTTSPTNGNIYAYLTPSEPITVLSTNWEARPDGTFRKAYPKNDKSPNWDQTVEFVDAAGNPGSTQVYIDWIDIVAPVAPQPVNPQNGLMRGTDSPLLDWNSVVDATSYEVRAATSPGRSPNANDGELNGADAVTLAPVTDSELQLTGLADGWLWWQVRAIDAAGNVGPWSNIWATGVDTTAPTVTLLTPGDGTVFTVRDFTLVWSGSESGVTYEVQTSLNPATDVDGALGDLIGTLSLTGDSAAVTGSPDGVYFWQVRATDGVGNVGPWAAPFQLTVDADVDLPTASTGGGGGPAATTTTTTTTTQGAAPEEQLTTFALEESTDDSASETAGGATGDEQADPEATAATAPAGFDATLVWLFAALGFAMLLLLVFFLIWRQRRSAA